MKRIAKPSALLAAARKKSCTMGSSATSITSSGIGLSSLVLRSGAQMRFSSTAEGGGPAMPPGYVPIEQRSADDESLKFTSATSTTPAATMGKSASAVAAASSSTVVAKANSAAALATDGVYRPNGHLVEGYVREDGKVLTRRGDGESAILEFVDPLPPTKLGQLKNDLVNKATPSTAKEMRKAAVEAFLPNDVLTRQLSVKSREDWIDKMDEAQRRKDGGVSEQQLPIYDEDGRKTFMRETSRGYRSADGGRTLLPKDKALLGEGDDSAHNDGVAAAAAKKSSSSSFEGGAAPSSSSSAGASSSPSSSREVDAEQQAVLDALRHRRNKRSNRLFSNIATIDEEDATQVARPTVTPPTGMGGHQAFVRHEAHDGEETLQGDRNVRRFDPFQQMQRDQEASLKAKREAAKAAHSVWAEDFMGGGTDSPKFRGDVMAENVRTKGGFAGTYTAGVEGEVPAYKQQQQQGDAKGEDYNEAGDVKISKSAANSTAFKQFDSAQYRRDMEELEYYNGSSSYEERKKAFDAKYDQDSMDPAEAARYRAPYTEEQLAQGLQNEPIDMAHTSLKFQQALTSNPVLKFHPGIISNQMGLNTFKGYAFPPSVELGKLQTDVAIEAQRQQGLETKARQKDVLEKVTGFDPVQRKQVRLALADFDYKDAHTSVHVLHSYPFADNLSVMIVCGIFFVLYKAQLLLDADEFYQEFLGIDIRVFPEVRKVMYGVIAFVIAGFLVHPANLSAIALTRAYRIYMRRPIGPP